MCTPQDISEYEEFFSRAENFLDRDEPDAFEEILHKIRYKNYEILERDDQFIVYDFEQMTKNPAEYLDREKFFRLKQIGEKAIADEDFTTLRKVVDNLYYLRAISRDDSRINIAKE